MTTQTLTIPTQATDHPFTDAQVDAAASLLRHIPRDQALGLRLLALAQACAAVHMTQAALDPAPEGLAAEEIDLLLGRSQASSLMDRTAEDRSESWGERP
ncbi:MAG: hypothetical protein K2Q20_04230 [Phycisphaerales bacterium]|nr:hypothetical protein [Phycisphaerales bacterium]